jgi:hypothetical protein
MWTRAIPPVLVLAALVGLGGAGCSKQLQHTVLRNQPPIVRLTWAPIDTQSDVFYIYKLNWVGYDPDGRVVRFEYAVDPPRGPGAVINWTSTTNSEETIQFECTKPESAFQSLPLPRSEDFHVFAIRAVDNLGAVSEPVKRAFYSFGVAPIAQILEPVPQVVLMSRVTPAVHIVWTGKDFVDPYGYDFEKPLYYRYKLFKQGNDGVHWDAWTQDPDSLRREVAPEFVGWDSTGSDRAEVQYANLAPGSEYLFVVVAIGRSGAYSPIFDFSSNMLRMLVSIPSGGPQITLFNSFFSYTYVSGGVAAPTDPSWGVQLQVPAGQPLTFNWYATPPPGSDMKRYRWVLDPRSLDDETPRTDPNDWYHWSPWSLTQTSATVGPFAGAGGDTGEVHDFFLEAEDTNGRVSLGWVHFHVYRPAFAKDLLIVNDTRFNADQIVSPAMPDTLRPPFGAWPTRAELDTFLFAVGGVRWRMTPPGWLSPPGIFKGYRFDTLGTRYGQGNPTIPLDVLGQYRHIVWMTDFRGSELGNSPASLTLPMTTLRYMSAPNRQNALATWVSQGGKLWALGSGFGNATNGPWNNPTNDVNQVRTYSSNGVGRDLEPGRFMYDLAHWRTEFRVFGPAFVRFARYDQPDPTVGSPQPAVCWKGGTFRDPAYTLLPTALSPRDPMTDPLWPYRTPTDFYIGNRAYSSRGVNLEFISQENHIREQVPAPSPANPESTVEVATLDSLYLAYGAAYSSQMNQSSQGEGVNPMMTYYHGRDNAPLVFSGTSIWDFRRQHCVALADFVLGQLWNLPKNVRYASRVQRIQVQQAVPDLRSAGPSRQVRSSPEPARVPRSSRPFVK